MNIKTSRSTDLLALDRRRFLRNLGVCLALPALEAFPARVLAAAEIPAPSDKAKSRRSILVTSLPTPLLGRGLAGRLHHPAPRVPQVEQ